MPSSLMWSAGGLFICSVISRWTRSVWRGGAIATGLNASPGAATGAVVFSADEAEHWAKDEGTKVILVRRETTPDDYHGMIAAQGILTSAGGTNSHAAVVARHALGRPPFESTPPFTPDCA